jgi:putative Mg2+ transporter-C (MgtC) family protein
MDPTSSDILLWPDSTQAWRVIVRLSAATLLGGLVGVERERMGKAAGLRTHMLVSLGAAIFALVPREIGLSDGDMGRVVQGVAAGIGFIGGGAILKMSDREEVKGLTTAAGIWLTAAVGLAAGVGLVWLALVAAACAWIILSMLLAAERRIGGGRNGEQA